MNKKIEISFLIEAETYCTYKDICYMNHTNPANDMKQYIINYIENDKKMYKGYKILYIALCSSKVRKLKLSYKGWEKNRQKKLAMQIINENADMVIVEDYIYVSAKIFNTYMESSNFQMRYMDKKNSYAVFGKKGFQMEMEDDDGMPIFRCLKAQEDKVLICPVPYVKSDWVERKGDIFLKYCCKNGENGIILGYCIPDKKEKISCREKLCGASKMRWLYRQDTTVIENQLSDKSMYLYRFFK